MDLASAGVARGGLLRGGVGVIGEQHNADAKGRHVRRGRLLLLSERGSGKKEERERREAHARWSLWQRQADRERRSLPFLTDDADGAVVRLDDGLGDVEAEAEAAVVTARNVA